jgi:hypothetical protein
MVRRNSFCALLYVVLVVASGREPGNMERTGAALGTTTASLGIQTVPCLKDYLVAAAFAVSK